MEKNVKSWSKKERKKKPRNSDSLTSEFHSRYKKTDLASKEVKYRFSERLPAARKVDRFFDNFDKSCDLELRL